MKIHNGQPNRRGKAHGPPRPSRKAIEIVRNFQEIYMLKRTENEASAAHGKATADSPISSTP